MDNRQSQTVQASHRRAFTLLELLIVVTIAVMVTSAMIPMMSAASDARRLREGARLLSTFLSAAQTRAVATGRSTGIVIQRQKNNNMASMDLFMAETPLPYIGDAANSTASVSWNSNASPPSGMVTFQNSPSISSQSIRPGDMIRFNYRGQLYLLDYGDTTNQYVNFSGSVPITPTDPTNYQSPVANAQAAVPFQIFRQPVKTLDAPAQIVDGAAIDLYFSGIDFGGNSTFGGITNFSLDPRPLVVTFSPTGALENVYAQGGVVRPVSGVYFLVGKAQNIPQPSSGTPNPVPATPNWQDLDCKWVSIGRQSGLVTVTEVRSANSVINSRFFAQGGQSATGN